MSNIKLIASTFWIFASFISLKAQDIGKLPDLPNLPRISHLPVTVTNFGVLPAARGEFDYQLKAAKNLTAHSVRDQILLSSWNGNNDPHVDKWLSNGYKVILNINNDALPSAFPTNLKEYEKSLRSVLKVYRPEVVVIENEELNENDGNAKDIYHTGSMADYIKELEVAVRVCKEKHLPVTNGGLTNPIISSLYYYYITHNKQDSADWLVERMDGVAVDPHKLARTDSLLTAYKMLPLSYVNLHWYEPKKGMDRATGGVLKAIINYITQRTGKKVITNETGVKSSDPQFILRLMSQWDYSKVEYVIFYDSGLGDSHASPLTSTRGALLPNGIAFKYYLLRSTQQNINASKTGAGNIDDIAAKDEFDSKIEIKLYPNPVKNIMHIEGLNPGCNTTLSIVSFTGAIVNSVSVAASSYNWNIERLPQGMYYLRVQKNEGFKSKLFLKE